MDFGDFLTTTAALGTKGRGRFHLVYLGAGILIGAGLGVYAAYYEFVFPNMISGFFTGGLLGWFLAALLRGLLAFIVIAVIAIGVSILYTRLTGGAA